MTEGIDGGGDFLTSLPADIQSHGSLKNFTGADGGVKLARSFIEAQGVISSRSMADMSAPTDDAGVRAVLTKLGHIAPDTPEGYKLAERPNTAAFRALAHKHGLTAKVAEAMFEEIATTQTQATEKRKAEDATTRTEAEKTLRAELGEKYDSSMENGTRAAEHFLSEEERKFIQESGLLHRLPGLQKFFNAAGQSMQEGTLHTGSNMASGPTDKAGFHAERVKIEAQLVEMKNKPGFDSLNGAYRQLSADRDAMLRKEGEAHFAALNPK